MKHFSVTGMSCASCSARIEKEVSKMKGVASCSVSLLTNSMNVEGTVADSEVILAVEKAGYGAAVKDLNNKASEKTNTNSKFEDKETPALKKRLVASLGFLFVLMYFSMGNMMWNWPVPAFFDGNHIAIGLLELLLTVVIMVINQRFFINGYKSLFHLAPNMDSLVALGSSAAFIYSVYKLFALTSPQTGESGHISSTNMAGFYFESAAMILTLITVGKMLEARSKGKTTNALRSLIALSPKTATVIIDGKEFAVPVEKVQVGSIFVVRPGESIPLDGEVINGNSAVDESALTGESVPVDKTEGSDVTGGTINKSGFLTCKAVRTGEDTVLAKIIQMVTDASSSKAPIAKTADKISGVFVPIVICIAAMAVLVWLIAGEDIGFALSRGISVLVISCPCALGLATPVAIMVGNGIGAKSGILFKTAASLEETGKAKFVVLDKTGTITNGTPSVADIIPFDGIAKEELVLKAEILERRSEHPLAKAIIDYIGELSYSSEDVTDFEVFPGNGLTCVYKGARLYGGNLSFISGKIKMDEQIKEKAENLSRQGKTPLFFTEAGKFLGLIATSDAVKKDSYEAINSLKNLGMKTVMLTGDNKWTAQAIGGQIGIDEVIAGVLPDGKEKAIRSFQKKGRTIMVGDGINDAPALTCADVGIAIGAGSDIAIDSADIVLMKNSLLDVVAAVTLSRLTLRNIHENLFWAFFYNIFGIPLAAGVFIPLFHWELTPEFGAAAMSLSSFCVVANALRLNFCDIHKKQNKKVNICKASSCTKKDKNMKKTIKIEGMMCSHCESRVKQALDSLKGVQNADVSHEKGTATVVLVDNVENETLKNAIESQGYKVISFF